jgi:hypothetical protein
MHKVLIELLKRFEVRLDIHELGGLVAHLDLQVLYPFTEPETNESCFLIPSLLPATKPDIGVIWLESDPAKVQFGRTYRLDFIPTGTERSSQAALPFPCSASRSLFGCCSFCTCY